MVSHVVAERSAPDRQLLRAFVFGLDEGLRRLNEVREFSSHPDCLFRIQRRTAPCDFQFEDGTRLKRGDPVLALHLWNEHIPPIGEQTSLGWAARMARMFEFSLEELAGSIGHGHADSDIAAIVGDMTLGLPGDAKLVRKLIRRFGFVTLPKGGAPGLSGRLHRLGENVLALLFALAANPGSARLDILRRGRTLVSMSRRTLICRYAREPDTP